jgi:hypothetical protein
MTRVATKVPITDVELVDTSAPIVPEPPVDDDDIDSLLASDA